MWFGALEIRGRIGLQAKSIAFHVRGGRGGAGRLEPRRRGAAALRLDDDEVSALIFALTPNGAEVLAPLVAKAPARLVAEVRAPHSVEELMLMPIESYLDGAFPDSPRGLWTRRVSHDSPPGVS